MKYKAARCVVYLVVTDKEGDTPIDVMLHDVVLILPRNWEVFDEASRRDYLSKRKEHVTNSMVRSMHYVTLDRFRNLAKADEIQKSSVRLVSYKPIELFDQIEPELIANMEIV